MSDASSIDFSLTDALGCARCQVPWHDFSQYTWPRLSRNGAKRLTKERVLPSSIESCLLISWRFTCERILSQQFLWRNFFETRFRWRVEVLCFGSTAGSLHRLRMGRKPQHKEKCERCPLLPEWSVATHPTAVTNQFAFVM